MRPLSAAEQALAAGYCGVPTVVVSHGIGARLGPMMTASAIPDSPAGAGAVISNRCCVIHLAKGVRADAAAAAAQAEEIATYRRSVGEEEAAVPQEEQEAGQSTVAGGHAAASGSGASSAADARAAASATGWERARAEFAPPAAPAEACLWPAHGSREEWMLASMGAPALECGTPSGLVLAGSAVAEALAEEVLGSPNTVSGADMRAWVRAVNDRARAHMVRDPGHLQVALQGVAGDDPGMRQAALAMLSEAGISSPPQPTPRGTKPGFKQRLRALCRFPPLLSEARAGLAVRLSPLAGLVISGKRDLGAGSPAEPATLLGGGTAARGRAGRGDEGPSRAEEAVALLMDLPSDGSDPIGRYLYAMAESSNTAAHMDSSERLGGRLNASGTSEMLATLRAQRELAHRSTGRRRTSHAMPHQQELPAWNDALAPLLGCTGRVMDVYNGEQGGEKTENDALARCPMALVSFDDAERGICARAWIPSHVLCAASGPGAVAPAGVESLLLLDEVRNVSAAVAPELGKQLGVRDTVNDESIAARTAARLRQRAAGSVSRAESHVGVAFARRLLILGSLQSAGSASGGTAQDPAQAGAGETGSRVAGRLASDPALFDDVMRDIFAGCALPQLVITTCTPAVASALRQCGINADPDAIAEADCETTRRLASAALGVPDSAVASDVTVTRADREAGIDWTDVLTGALPDPVSELGLRSHLVRSTTAAAAKLASYALAIERATSTAVLSDSADAAVSSPSRAAGGAAARFESAASEQDAVGAALMSRASAGADAQHCAAASSSGSGAARSGSATAGGFGDPAIRSDANGSSSELLLSMLEEALAELLANDPDLIVTALAGSVSAASLSTQVYASGKADASTVAIRIAPQEVVPNAEVADEASVAACGGMGDWEGAPTSGRIAHGLGKTTAVAVTFCANKCRLGGAPGTSAAPMAELSIAHAGTQPFGIGAFVVTAADIGTARGTGPSHFTKLKHECFRSGWAPQVFPGASVVAQLRAAASTRSAASGAGAATAGGHGGDESAALSGTHCEFTAQGLREGFWFAMWGASRLLHRAKVALAGSVRVAAIVAELGAMEASDEVAAALSRAATSQKRCHGMLALWTGHVARLRPCLVHAVADPLLATPVSLALAALLREALAVTTAAAQLTARVPRNVAARAASSGRQAMESSSETAWVDPGLFGSGVGALFEAARRLTLDGDSARRPAAGPAWTALGDDSRRLLSSCAALLWSVCRLAQAEARLAFFVGDDEGEEQGLTVLTSSTQTLADVCAALGSALYDDVTREGVSCGVEEPWQVLVMQAVVAAEGIGIGDADSLHASQADGSGDPRAEQLGPKRSASRAAVTAVVDSHRVEQSILPDILRRGSGGQRVLEAAEVDQEARAASASGPGRPPGRRGSRGSRRGSGSNGGGSHTSGKAKGPGGWKLWTLASLDDEAAALVNCGAAVAAMVFLRRWLQLRALGGAGVSSLDAVRAWAAAGMTTLDAVTSGLPAALVAARSSAASAAGAMKAGSRPVPASRAAAVGRTGVSGSVDSAASHASESSCSSSRRRRRRGGRRRRASDRRQSEGDVEAGTAQWEEQHGQSARASGGVAGGASESVASVASTGSGVARAGGRRARQQPPPDAVVPAPAAGEAPLSPRASADAMMAATMAIGGGAFAMSGMDGGGGDDDDDGDIAMAVLMSLEASETPSGPAASSVSDSAPAVRTGAPEMDLAMTLHPLPGEVALAPTATASTAPPAASRPSPTATGTSLSPARVRSAQAPFVVGEPCSSTVGPSAASESSTGADKSWHVCLEACQAVAVADAAIWTEAADAELVEWVDRVDLEILSKRERRPASLWDLSLKRLVSDDVLTRMDSAASANRAAVAASGAVAACGASETGDRSQHGALAAVELLESFEHLRRVPLPSLRRRLVLLSSLQAAVGACLPLVDLGECMQAFQAPAVDPASPFLASSVEAAALAPATLSPRASWYNTAQLLRWGRAVIASQPKEALLRRSLRLTGIAGRERLRAVTIDRFASFATTGVGLATSARMSARRNARGLASLSGSSSTMRPDHSSWPGKADGFGASLLEQVAASLHGIEALDLQQRATGFTIAFNPRLLFESVVGEMGPYRAIFADFARELQLSAGVGIAGGNDSDAGADAATAADFPSVHASGSGDAAGAAVTPALHAPDRREEALAGADASEEFCGWSVLPVTAQTPNGEANEGEAVDRVLWSPACAQNPARLRAVRAAGALMGCALRTCVSVPVPLAAPAWDALVGYAPTRGQLRRSAERLIDEMGRRIDVSLSGPPRKAPAAAVPGAAVSGETEPEPERAWGEMVLFGKANPATGEAAPALALVRPLWSKLVQLLAVREAATCAASDAGAALRDPFADPCASLVETPAEPWPFCAAADEEIAGTREEAELLGVGEERPATMAVEAAATGAAWLLGHPLPARFPVAAALAVASGLGSSRSTLRVEDAAAGVSKQPQQSWLGGGDDASDGADGREAEADASASAAALEADAEDELAEEAAVTASHSAGRGWGGDGDGDSLDGDASEYLGMAGGAGDDDADVAEAGARARLVVKPWEAVSFAASVVRGLAVSQVAPSLAARSGMGLTVALSPLSLFTGLEAERVISGRPMVDVDLLRRNTIFKKASASTDVVRWLFQVLESWSHAKRSRFVAFGCGLDRLPTSMQGYKDASLRMQVEVLTQEDEAVAVAKAARDAGRGGPGTRSGALTVDDALGLPLHQTAGSAGSGDDVAVAYGSMEADAARAARRFRRPGVAPTSLDARTSMGGMSLGTLHAMAHGVPVLPGRDTQGVNARGRLAEARRREMEALEAGNEAAAERWRRISVLEQERFDAGLDDREADGEGRHNLIPPVAVEPRATEAAATDSTGRRAEVRALLAATHIVGTGRSRVAPPGRRPAAPRSAAAPASGGSGSQRSGELTMGELSAALPEAKRRLDGRLVAAHACFFNITLPQYSSKAVLETQLELSIREGGTAMTRDEVEIGRDGLARGLDAE